MRYSNKRRCSNKSCSFTENNLISAAVLIWVFTNKRPTFITAPDTRNIKTISLEKQKYDQLSLYIPLSVLPVVEISTFSNKRRTLNRENEISVCMYVKLIISIIFCRNIGMGSSTSLARIGSFASPYIIHLVSSETKNAKENIFKTKNMIFLFYEIAIVSNGV